MPRAAAGRGRRALVVAGTVAACAAVGLAAAQTPRFRAEVDLVPVAVTVTDRSGAPVPGLSAADFQVTEDGRPQTIAFFSRGDTTVTPAAGAPEAPRPDLHLGLLLDVSESMQDDVAFTRTAAVKFLNLLTDAVDVTVVDFDSEIRTTRYPQADFARLVERIRQPRVRGLTALYDAIGTYLDGAAGQGGRTVMLLYTDGGDTRSALSRRELMDLLKASNVTIYPVGALSHQAGVLRSEQEQLLRDIASATGGQAFFPNSQKDLDREYARVVAEIRAQYSLGYMPTNAELDGTWRKVQVRLTGPRSKDLRVRTRPGYFAPLRPRP